jgi:hypothetical protein
MKCAFCFYGDYPVQEIDAKFVIDGVSVCEDHVDKVSGQGFGRDLYAYQQEIEKLKGH